MNLTFNVHPTFRVRNFVVWPFLINKLWVARIIWWKRNLQIPPINLYAADDYFGQYKMMQKTLKMTETLAYGHSSESTQWDPSNEYQHDRVQMFFKNLQVLVLWTKVASAMEGLAWSHWHFSHDAWLKFRPRTCNCSGERQQEFSRQYAPFLSHWLLKLQPTHRLWTIIGYSHFFGNWVLEILCSSNTNGVPSDLLQHAAPTCIIWDGIWIPVPDS